MCEPCPLHRSWYTSCRSQSDGKMWVKGCSRSCKLWGQCTYRGKRISKTSNNGFLLKEIGMIMSCDTTQCSDQAKVSKEIIAIWTDDFKEMKDHSDSAKAFGNSLVIWCLNSEVIYSWISYCCLDTKRYIKVIQDLVRLLQLTDLGMIDFSLRQGRQL